MWTYTKNQLRDSNYDPKIEPGLEDDLLGIFGWFGINSAAKNIVNQVTIKDGVVLKPLQIHHYATDKSKLYTPQIEEIASRYNLKLNDAWNKDLLPHQGRHANEYHDYILQNMRIYDDIAKGDTDLFLKQFENLKKDIKLNPSILYKDYWGKVQ